MPNTPITDSTHTRSKELSYKNLQAAREEHEVNGYDSAEDRAVMARAFEEGFGGPARDWQLDVGEAICLKLDSVLIAGTGEGKTIPYMLPLLRNKKHKALILSPLKVLQEDQVRRFREMGIEAAAVNGDTWSPKLKRMLENGQIQAIFASPEMCLQHPDFRAYLSDASMSQELTMVVVDEAHCISQWGGEFRKDYANLDRLRAFFPTHVPFLVASATLTPSALRDIQTNLNIQLDKAFFLNLGNDRPNVTMSVQYIKSPTDYDARGSDSVFDRGSLEVTPKRMGTRQTEPETATPQHTQPAQKHQGSLDGHITLDDDVLAIIFGIVITSVKEFFSIHIFDRPSSASLSRSKFLEKGPLGQFPVVQQLHALTMVSKRWRAVALSGGILPALALDPQLNPQRFEKVLGWSKVAPLVVDFEDYLSELGYGDRPSEQYHTILSDMHRTRGLNFVTEMAPAMMETVPPLMNALREPAPNLEVLVLRTCMTNQEMRGVLRMSRPYTFERNGSFLGNCESNLKHLILEDHVVLPSLTNPAFDKLVTLKINTSTSHIHVKTILPWLAKDLRSLQRLSFKGISKDDGTTINSDLGWFALPPSLKKFTVGGHTEPCAAILNSVSIPPTCSVRVLVGAHREPDYPAPDKRVVQECARVFACVWLNDSSAKVHCTAIELVLDEAKESRTRLETYLGVSCVSAGRRVDLRFAHILGDYERLAFQAFSNELSRGAPLVLSEDSWLRVRIQAVRHQPTLDGLRSVLRLCNSVKRVDVLRYDHHGDQWKDILGILPSTSAKMRTLNQVHTLRVYSPLKRDANLKRVVRRSRKLIPLENYLEAEERDDSKFMFSDFTDMRIGSTPSPRNKHFMGLYIPG